MEERRRENMRTGKNDEKKRKNKNEGEYKENNGG